MQREIPVACDFLPGVTVWFNLMVSEKELLLFASSGAAEGGRVVSRVDGWNDADGPTTGPDAPWAFRQWLIGGADGKQGVWAAIAEFKQDPNSLTA